MDGIPAASHGALPFGAMHRDWAEALDGHTGRLEALAARLDAVSAAGRLVLPARADTLRAFSRPLREVKVVIVGQDPYPTAGHAVGLAFSVARQERALPRSLANIYRELAADLGAAAPIHGDLSGWSRQGVLLLNRVLTVEAGAPASHRGWGWEELTSAAIETLAKRGGPLVAVLWGRDAQRVKPLLGDTPVVESPHPSPLSAARGFFGSRPFTRVNELLQAQGAEPVDWLDV
jgi:uracil-DNA glycosylase